MSGVYQQSQPASPTHLLPWGPTAAQPALACGAKPQTDTRSPVCRSPILQPPAETTYPTVSLNEVKASSMIACHWGLPWAANHKDWFPPAALLPCREGRLPGVQHRARRRCVGMRACMRTREGRPSDSQLPNVMFTSPSLLFSWRRSCGTSPAALPASLPPTFQPPAPSPTTNEPTNSTSEPAVPAAKSACACWRVVCQRSRGHLCSTAVPARQRNCQYHRPPVGEKQAPWFVDARAAAKSWKQ